MNITEKRKKHWGEREKGKGVWRDNTKITEKNPSVVFDPKLDPPVLK